MFGVDTLTGAISWLVRVYIPIVSMVMVTFVTVRGGGTRISVMFSRVKMGRWVICGYIFVEE